MQISWVAYAGFGISLVLLIIVVVTAFIAIGALRVNKRMFYMNFREIIEKHHSKEVRALRQQVLESIQQKGEEAKKQERLLKDIDSDFHAAVSDLANYYESLGILLKHGWKSFPDKGVKDMLLSMLHNSTINTREAIDPYIDIIYPKRSRIWGNNYLWLYEKSKEFKEDMVTKEIIH